MDFNITNLSWAVQRALNYNIINKIRLVSYDINTTTNNCYNLKVVVDNELTEIEKDIIFSIDGEIIGHFDQVVNSNLNIVVDSKTHLLS